MARPRKEGLDYFSHDTDLSSDEKIESLESAFGNNGYAVYLKLLERIYRNGGKLVISDDETRNRLAKKCNIDDVNLFINIINFMVKIELFKKSLWNTKNCLTSSGVIKRFQFVDAKRDRDNKRYKKNISAIVSTAKPIRKLDKEYNNTSNKTEIKEYNSETPPEKHGLSDLLKSIDEDVKNYRNIGMTDEWIKNFYVRQEVPEVDVDRVLGKKF